MAKPIIGPELFTNLLKPSYWGYPPNWDTEVRFRKVGPCLAWQVFYRLLEFIYSTSKWRPIGGGYRVMATLPDEVPAKEWEFFTKAINAIIEDQKAILDKEDPERSTMWGS